MANLLLVVRDGPSYKNGDVLCAFSRRCIEFCHCHMQCFERDPNHRRLKAVDNPDGLVPQTDVLYDYCTTFYEFRYDRLSENELLITRLSDGVNIRVQSNVPFDSPFSNKTEQIDIKQFLDRQLKTLRSLDARGRPIFKNDQSLETWFGGRMSHGDINKVRAVWMALTNKKGVLRTELRFRHYPLGQQDIRSFLPISTTDFDDGRAAQLVEPEYDLSDPENPQIIKKRKKFVNWRDDVIPEVGVPEGDVIDKRKPIDIRPVMVPKQDNIIVKDKV